MKLTKDNLAEAELDLRRLNDPAYGGFNLSYGDNYFAKGLVEKWGMPLNELDKAIGTLKSIMAGTIHQEPVEFAHCPAENCVLCGKPTRTWLDPHTPLCGDCANKGLPTTDEWCSMRPIGCQEADPFLSRTGYVPCGKPGNAVVWSVKDNRAYVMCEMCASHAVKNRGMRLLAKLPDEVPQA